MQGDEIRALRRLQREQGPSSHVFMTIALLALPIGPGKQA
jgi:hypothetical protein